MKKTSKFLSYVLRHAPQSIGLTLDREGWADVDELMERCVAAGQELDRQTLLEIVATSDKKRFTLSDDLQRIRAAQGHSVEVDLGLAPVEPPTVLYHGTASRHVASIRAEGLVPGARRQVHLSGDKDTARAVGTRHGAPVVLVVAAALMHSDGFQFYRADNGVWLTDRVPPRYLGD